MMSKDIRREHIATRYVSMIQICGDKPRLESDLFPNKINSILVAYQYLTLCGASERYGVLASHIRETIQSS